MVRRMFLTVVLIFALVGIDAVSLPFPGARLIATDVTAQEALLDLPWITPGPADLDTEGYGLTYGVYQTAASDGVSVYGNPGPLTAYDEAFSTAGPIQTYYEAMSLRSDDDPDIVARQLSIVLAEFGDDDDAETGFAAVADIFATYDQTRTPPEVGDEAVAFRGEFTSSDGRAYQELRILLRTGPFLADLVIDDYLNDAPATSELTPMADLLVERLENAAADSPELSLGVVRIAGEDVTTFYDYYTRRGGDEVPGEGESSSGLQSDDEFFDEAGATDVYYYVAEVLPGEEDSTLVSSAVEIYHFTDEDLAADYLETAPEDWIEFGSTGYEEIEIVDDAEQLGDGSVTVAYEQDSSYGPLAGYRIWVQTGDDVASLELDGDPAISLSVAEEMARAGLACLEEGGCVEPLPATELTQAEPAASEEDTPEAEEDDSRQGDGDETPQADVDETPANDEENP